MLSRLINKNDWNKIQKLLEKGKIKPRETVGDTNLLQVAAANNQHKFIESVLKEDPQLLLRSDKHGDSAVQTLAKYGHTELLKKIIKKEPESINIINADGFTVPQILIKDTNFLKWLIDRNIYIDLNSLNGRNSTLINMIIDETKTENDQYHKLLIKLLEREPDLNFPTVNPPLLQAVSQDKKYLFNLLIDFGADVNVKNHRYQTPLMIATRQADNDTVKYLIKKGADLNYSGKHSDKNLLVDSIKKGKTDLARTLIDSDFNVDKYDRDLETSLHEIFGDKLIDSYDTLSRLMYVGNMNKQDERGNTPLHYLLQNYDWKKMIPILEKKQLDIFIKNNEGIAPYQQIKKEDLSLFIDTVAKGYLKSLTSQKINVKDRFSCNKKTECLRVVRENILKNKQSVVNNDNKKQVKTEINFIIGTNSNFGLFNADIIHNFIYTLIVLNRNKILGTPYQYYFEDRAINDNLILINNDCYKSSEDKVVSELFNGINGVFYELAPYIILWRSPNVNFIHPNLKFHLQKTLQSDKIRFVLIKLTLVVSENGSHANMILYDKQFNTVERFEPYGDTPMMNSDKLDEFLTDNLCPMFNSKTKYVKPKDYIETPGFQLASYDDNTAYKKLGDPAGYCLAWCFWYIEMRVTNPNLNQVDLIVKCKKIIIDTYKHSDTPFLDHIRRYARQLDSDKNKIMENAKINREEIYNYNMTIEDQQKLMKYIIDEFNKLVSEW